jgi:hydrogenase nickel incorporation protein HypA/HybF
MHEEALLRDLRRRIERIAGEQDAPEISRVALWVGALSHISEETLRSRWPDTVAGTPAERARLDLRFSTDLDDPRAAGIVLTEVDVAGRAEPRAGGPPSS